MDDKHLPVNTDSLALQLKKAGYDGLFLYGEHSLSDSVWQNGQHKEALFQIVSSATYDDYVRLLASEVLYEKQPDYPPADFQDTLAYLYAKAIEITGSPEGAFFSGNLWGFMYHWDKNVVVDYGTLGTHLMHTGKKSVPHLLGLLGDAHPIFYVGSEDATIGNSLRYRVKDVAAYYLGKITGIPATFYDKWPERDAEIERLKEKWKAQE